MTSSQHLVPDERLSELVAHLSGAPLVRSRALVHDSAAGRNRDELFMVADALVRLGCRATPRPVGAAVAHLARG